MKVRVAALGVLAASALVLAGCSSDPMAPTKDEQGTNQKSAAEQAPAGFSDYYTQNIDWRDCEAGQIVPPMAQAPSNLSGYQCAKVTAPMDWNDPGSKPITLAIARHVNKQKDAAPALFYNLGGPGGGAVDSLTMVVQNVLTDEVVKNFQVVALDPRGVGASSPVRCLTDAELDKANQDQTDTSGMTTEEIVEKARKDVADFGAKCLAKNGEIVGYVDSDSATRDFDMVRALLGQQKFDYVGFSYGTLIGAIYAELFPQHVGRMVLDGAIDPSLSVNQLSALQVAGMEGSLDHWIQECQKDKKCPLTGDLDSAKKQLLDLLDSWSKNPLPTGNSDRTVNMALAYTAIIGSLYDPEMYPVLTQAITMGKMGDGTMLQFLSDYFNSRGDDGVYWDNSSDAFNVINYLDYSPVGTPEEWQKQSDELARKYPVVGSNFGMSSAGLDAWPFERRVTRHKITAPGTPPILVIGTTNDPATPYVMAQALANDLQSGVLLTVDGWKHTAYSRAADKCVINSVDGFLLKGEVPKEGTTCKG